MKNPDIENYGERDEDKSVHEGHVRQMVDYYARTGSKYNLWHCDPSDDSSHNYAVREVFTILKKTKSTTLLDVCCGTGRATKAALDQGYQAIGLDVSQNLLDIGKKELGIPAECLVEGDATQLPFADNSFDVTCILGALHHTAMPRRVVAELIRVTRHAIVISDEGNHLTGGIKHTLVQLGVFDPVYRLIFRREPRRHRRQLGSEEDGPTFVFSIEEVIPMLKDVFTDFKCLTFYRVAGRNICSYFLPRIFAKFGVITVSGKKQ